MYLVRSFKVILLVITCSSITYLYPDTNDFIANPETAISEPIATPILEPIETEHPLASHLAESFERLDAVLGMIFTLKANQIDQITPLLMPVFEVMTAFKQNQKAITNNKDIYHSYQIANACAQYLGQVLTGDVSQMEEFNLLIERKEDVSPAMLDEVTKKLSDNVKILSEKINELIQDFITGIFNEVRGQLVKVDKILQTVNTNVGNNPKATNKAEIKQTIMDLRNCLRQMQRDMSSMGASMEVITNVYKLNKAVLCYLNDAQKEKFLKWPPFDPIVYLTRTKADEQSGLEELLNDIATTTMHLNMLEKDAEKIDLTFINHTARFVGDYIVDPIYRYKLLPWIAATATTATGIGYLGYYADGKFFKDPNCWFRKLVGFPNHDLGSKVPSAFVDQTTLGFLEKYLGEPAQVDALNLAPISDTLDTIHKLESLTARLKGRVGKPIIPLATIEEFLANNKLGVSVIAGSIIASGYYFYSEIWKDAEPKLTRKLTAWFNRTKGGSYIKLADKLDDFLPTTTFADIIGLEYAKSLVYPHLKYIKDPERWDADDITPPTGILLTGPTRTGKTYFAKAICGELHKQNPDQNLRFFSLDVRDIKEKGIIFWLGFAKMIAPCVLFIDEIDLLQLQRTGNTDMLSEFLQGLSGIAEKDPKKQVIVIGVTNKPENIDKAMVQGGRLALEIRFELPKMGERKKHILKRLDQLAIDPEVFDIDVDKLARETNGCTFEELKLMLDAAFINIGIKGESLSQAHLERALDQQIRRIIDIDSREITDEEKLSIASHHAGQTLVHLLENPLEKIAKVTIRQVVVKVAEEGVWSHLDKEKKLDKKQAGLEQGALFTYLEHDTFNLQTHDQLVKKAKTLLAGAIAEKIVTGSASTFYGSKKNLAFTIIKTIVADGIEFEGLSKNAQDSIIDEAFALLRQYEAEVYTTLIKYEKSLQALTSALIEKQTITIDEIHKIIGAAAQANS